MAYCLACGCNRDTIGGFCRQCRADMARRKVADAKRCIHVPRAEQPHGHEPKACQP